MIPLNFYKNGPVMAVLDGRFLPLKAFGVEESLTNDYAGIDVIDSRSLAIRIETMRHPDPRFITDPSLLFFRVYNQEKVYSFDNVHLEQYDYGDEGQYRLEYRATDMSVEPRQP